MVTVHRHYVVTRIALFLTLVYAQALGSSLYAEGDGAVAALIVSAVFAPMEGEADSLGVEPEPRAEWNPDLSGARAEIRTVSPLRYAEDQADRAAIRYEQPASDPWIAAPPRIRNVGILEPSVWRRGPFTSVQVNVDDFGRNIPGDAANEPSIAIDPTEQCKMAIGWRQFDTVESVFRQSGYGYSRDRGETWTFPGSLAPGEFGSDPVLAADSAGVFYYVSLGWAWPGKPGVDELRLFRSFDGGETWPWRIQVLPAFEDKPWMVIDTTGGMGDGHIYLNAPFFQPGRSTDGGLSFESFQIRSSLIATLAIGVTGDLYKTANRQVFRFAGAQDATSEITLAHMADLDVQVCPPGVTTIELDRDCFDPNPGGLNGQPWIAAGAGNHGSHVYVVDLGFCRGARDPNDIVFLRSTDGGVTFEPGVRINDDPYSDCSFQWFWTMSNASNGRIDVIWNDTRRYLVGNLSEVYYSYSNDAGDTWSKNIPVSRVFDSYAGREVGKLGDYYHMISDDVAANLAYAATFNGEQDVYFLRIGDCNGNGTHDSSDIADGTSTDLNANTVPDECEPGDFTGDIAVDLADMLVFTLCETGPCTDDSCDPPMYPAPVCALGDFDADGDLDLRDFAAFQSTFDLAAARPSW